MTTLVSSAFRSTERNQCFVFSGNKYVVVDYGRGVDKKSRVINGPVSIVDGFPWSENTLFVNGIDGSFDNDANQSFFFKDEKCAKVEFDPDTGVSRLLMGPIPITNMFSTLIDSPFATKLDAAMRSNRGKTVFFFSGDKVASFDYEAIRLVDQTRTISDAFPQFVGTVFEKGLDAAFNTHDRNEVYIFKDEHYAHFNLATAEFIGFIKKIRTEWPALRSILPAP